MKSRFTLLVALLICSIYAYSQDYTLTVNAPMSIQGDYGAELAAFGPQKCDIGEFNGNLNLVVDGTGGTEVCDTVVNDQTGFIAVLDRGTCGFVDKVREAQEKGAIGVIICNNVSDPIFSPGGTDPTIVIPSFMVSLDDCNAIKLEIPNTVNVTFTPNTLEDPNEDDLVVWGDQPGQGDFDNGLGGWVATGIDSERPDVVEAQDVLWIWDEDGIGTVSFNGLSMNSPTACNGLAFFDYTTLATGGDGNNIPPGPPYPQLIGELRSPLIDLSGVSNTVGVKFYQTNMPISDGEVNVSVRYSADGGASWVDTVAVETENFVNSGGSNVVGTEIVRLPLVGLSGSSNAVISFIFDGDFYYCGIDDVQIIEFADVDVEIFNVFVTPLSHTVPITHADADTFFISANAGNRGGKIIANLDFSVEIINIRTSESVYSDNQIFTNINVGEEIQVSLENTYVPTSLDTGTYEIIYSLEIPDEIETNISDNSFSYTFSISEKLWSKDNGPVTGANTLRGFGTHKWGAAYVTSRNVTDDVILDHVTFGITSDSSSLKDQFVDLFLVKLNEGITYPFGGDFDRNDASLSGHPSFTIVWQGTHIFTDESNFESIDVVVSDENNTILLEPASTYVLLADFQDFQAGDAKVSNKDLYINTNNLVEGSGQYIVLDDESPSWYTGFTGTNPAVILRLNLFCDVGSSTEDNELLDNTVSIFPNPVKNELVTEFIFSETTDIGIMITDLSGKVIMVRDINNVINEVFKFDVSSLANGTYLLRLSTEKGSKTKKFVIQR